MSEQPAVYDAGYRPLVKPVSVVPEVPDWARVVLRAMKRGMLAFLSDIEPLICKSPSTNQ